MPDFIPNKPTVVGSRGQNVGSGYLNRGASGAGAGSPKLPNLGSSGGIASNNPIMKNSVAARGNQASGAGLRGLPGLNNNVFQKYSSGLGAGIGSGGGGGPASNPYAMNYNENRQGEQGSIGTSGSGQNKPGSGMGGKGSSVVLPSVTNSNVAIGAIRSRGQGSSGGLGSSGS